MGLEPHCCRMCVASHRAPGGGVLSWRMAEEKHSVKHHDAAEANTSLAFKNLDTALQAARWQIQKERAQDVKTSQNTSQVQQARTPCQANHFVGTCWQLVRPYCGHTLNLIV